MMASMPQGFTPHPGGMQQPHPGVPPGHHLAPGMAHNPSQPGAQPGSIPPHLAQQMGVSAPGGQVNPSLMGMPGAPNAHALQHLNPQVQHMFGQQPVNVNFAAQQIQHQRLQAIQAQRQQQVLMAQAQQMGQYMPGGMPMGNNMMQIHPQQMAQYQALQARQMAARQAQNPQQAAMLQAQQQMALQHAQAQQANQHLAAQGQNPNQPAQINSQQMLQLQMHAQQQQQAAQHAQQQQAQQQQAHQQQAHQQQAQQQQQAQHQQAQHQQQQVQQTQHQQPQQGPQASQPQPQSGQPQTSGQQPMNQVPQANGPPPNQGQSQGPTQTQTNTQQPPTTQPQVQPSQPIATQMLAQQQMAMQAQAAAQAKVRDGMKGQSLLRLMSFIESLSGCSSDSRDKDVAHWQEFVNRFFSQRGIYRTNIHNKHDVEAAGHKSVEMSSAAVPHFFNASGAKKIDLQLGQGTTDKPVPMPLGGEGHFIENVNASLTMWFETSHVVHFGTLRVQFDVEQKIDLFEFMSRDHEEYVSRTVVVEGAKPNHNWIKDWHRVNSQDNKSPEMSKKGKARPMKSPPNAPPDLDIPHSAVKHGLGITEQLFQFLEIVEVMGAMNPLFQAAHQHPDLGAYRVLDDYVGSQINQSGAPNMNGQAMPSGPRTPGFGPFPLGASPHAAHLQLPGSPHIGSPAAGAMQAPAMQMQHSQQGTSSSGPSATTSPAGQKRRRPSGVKPEDDTPGNAPTPSAAAGAVAVNGVTGNKTKPQTPRMQKKARVGGA